MRVPEPLVIEGRGKSRCSCGPCYVCSWDGSPGCCWCCERLWIFLLNSRGYTRRTPHQFEVDRRQTPNAKSSRKKMQSPAHDFRVKLMGKFTLRFFPIALN